MMINFSIGQTIFRILIINMIKYGCIRTTSLEFAIHNTFIVLLQLFLNSSDVELSRKKWSEFFI